MNDDVITTQEDWKDNLRRAVRTLLQFAAGFLLSGGVVAIWDNYVDGHEVDGTLTLAITLVLGFLVSYVQNAVEDKTGTGILLSTDRKAGDAVLDSGVGTKQGDIVDVSTDIVVNPTAIGYKPS